MIKLRGSNNLIAYFSMEIGIDPQIPTYAGGLGILAGDILRSFADLRIPAVGVTLLTESGYFTQHITHENQQEEHYQPWQPEKYLDLLDQEVVIRADHRDIYLKLWRYTITGLGDIKVPIIFLDTNHEQNSHEHRKLTQHLYPGNLHFRFLQEVVLGIGGAKALQSLNMNPTLYHLNEGHSALLTIELLKQCESEGIKEPINHVRERCVFTTHTPVESGHDKFSPKLVQEKLEPEDWQILKSIPEVFNGHGDLNMTLLGLTMSDHVNGVTQKHAAVSKQLFPKYNFTSITNGIHHTFWTSPSFYMLFDEYIPGWELDPFSLLGISNIPAERIERAHQDNKHRLVTFVNQFHKKNFKLDTFTIGYARRFTKYKRPDLLFFEIDKLEKIAEEYPLQVIFAGKAHPSDTVGKSLLSEILKLKDRYKTNIKLVFLENYNIKLAKLIIPGVDIWLNTPMRPLEASGTSGMKASLNGVPNLSVLDGWWLEGHMEGVTGWSIGHNPVVTDDSQLDCIDCDDSLDLYHKLKDAILPMYYRNRPEYSKIRRNSIALHGSYFNTHRVVQQYLIKSYLT